MSAFGSDALFSAFDSDGWSSNATKAPRVEDAYKTLPDVQLDTKERFMELQLENERLRRILNLVKPPKQNKDNETGPICQINFYHNSASRHHKDEIIKLVSEYISESERDREMETVAQLSRQRSAIEIPIEDDSSDDFTIIQSVQIFTSDFIVDKIGEPIGDLHSAEEANWKIPEFQSLYKDLLGENAEDDTQKIEAAKKKIANVCFNCGSESHGIKDCKEKRNPAEINRRKDELNKLMGPRRGGPQLRLFEASDSYGNNKKFAGLKPGIISDDLKKAIGLRQSSLPPWIYSMRRLGYPPGWLKEAEINESGVAVKEEGELNELNHISLEPTKQVLTGLDQNKIVDYPGYNSPVPTECTDSPPRGHPKYQSRDEKSLFISNFCKQNGIKVVQKRKIEDDNDDQTSPKRIKIENDQDNEGNDFEVIDQAEEEVKFVPGWVKRENTDEDEVSNKGLPSRSKWSDGVTEFRHDAYQPAPTKTGTFDKLQKTLKKNRK